MNSLDIVSVRYLTRPWHRSFAKGSARPMAAVQPFVFPGPRMNKAIKTAITSFWRPPLRALSAFFIVIAALALVSIFASAPALAQNAYIPNRGSDNVSVINLATNTIIATIPVGSHPQGLAVIPGEVLVANLTSDNVSVISTATNTVTATIPVGSRPYSAAVTPD